MGARVALSASLLCVLLAAVRLVRNPDARRRTVFSPAPRQQSARALIDEADLTIRWRLPGAERFDYDSFVNRYAIREALERRASARMLRTDSVLLILSSRAGYSQMTNLHGCSGIEAIRSPLQCNSQQHQYLAAPTRKMAPNQLCCCRKLGIVRPGRGLSLAPQRRCSSAPPPGAQPNVHLSSRVL